MSIFLKMKQIKDLSHSERTIVNFILKDPQRASNMGIVEIAEETFTSSSTVMRVTRKLGLDSFTDLRLQLAKSIRDIDTTALFKYQDPIDVGDSMSDILEKVTSSNVRAVLEVKKYNDVATFEKVIEMMSKAHQIDFYGSGVSNLICHDAMVKALRMGIPSTAYSFYSEMAMHALMSSRDNLAIILSYTGQTEDTLRVAKYLQENSIPSVSITSHTDNALLELCNINLFVDSYESAFRIGGMSSRLSSQHLLDVLFYGFMIKNYDKLRKAIDKTFLRETFHYLSSDSDIFDEDKK